MSNLIRNKEQNHFGGLTLKEYWSGSTSGYDFTELPKIQKQ